MTVNSCAIFQHSSITSKPKGINSKCLSLLRCAAFERLSVNTSKYKHTKASEATWVSFAGYKIHLPRNWELRTAGQHCLPFTLFQDYCSRNQEPIQMLVEWVLGETHCCMNKMHTSILRWAVYYESQVFCAGQKNAENPADQWMYAPVSDNFWS